MSQLPIIQMGSEGSVESAAAGAAKGGACGGGGGCADPAENRRLPKWLKRQVPKGNSNHKTAKLLEELRLETVCDNAKCPNRMECYSQQTATFMILGNVCTRPCSFCAVSRGRPEALEADEPERVAEAALRLGLKLSLIHI